MINTRAAKSTTAIFFLLVHFTPHHINIKSTMIRFILSLLLIVQIQAFAPRSSASFSPANVVQGVRPPSRVMKPLVVRMSDEKKGETEPIISADGTFYDDQVSCFL